MKRDLSQRILGLDGKPIEGVTDLCTIVHLALTTPLRKDAEAPLDLKLRLYRLAQATHKGGIVDLTSEDLSLIKERIGAVITSVVIIGRCCDMLETDPAPPPADGLKVYTPAEMAEASN